MFLVFDFAVNYNSEILKFIEFLDAAALVIHVAYRWVRKEESICIHFIFSVKKVNVFFNDLVDRSLSRLQEVSLQLS